jgi:hypothetical protein
MAAAAPTATADALIPAWVVIAMRPRPMEAGEIVAEETAAVAEISGTQRLTIRLSQRLPGLPSRFEMIHRRFLSSLSAGARGSGRSLG